MAEHTYTPDQLAEEAEEIRRAQRNPRAFDVLYRRYFATIFRFLARRLDDDDQAADLCQQVFLKAMLHLPKFRPRGVPFSAWLFRIAANEVNQYFRTSQRQRTVSIESVSTHLLVAELETSVEDPLPVLLSALDQLSLEELNFVEMRYFEQMPFRELASIYGITENNAKVRMHRLLKKLRRYVKASN